MTTRAIVRNVHVSPRKANLVCALIRNKKVVNALSILQNCNKKTAKILEKLLSSAIANATNNHAMDSKQLYVYRCVANQGRTIKRSIPRAKGSSNMIRKRHSHLEIILSDNQNEKINQKNKLISKNNQKKINNKPQQKTNIKPKINNKKESV